MLMGFASMAQQDQFAYTAFAQKMEMQAEKDDFQTEDDSFLQQTDYFRKHPLNLNEADEDEMRKLFLLNEFQIKNLISYRRLFGNLVNIYELQAVPGWNVATIQLLLPFITINDKKSMAQNLESRWSGGEHNFLINTSRVLEKAKGYLKPPVSANYYQGSRNRLYMRYKYNYKNILQWGILGDKDAGEQFFKGKQKAGFDFYSFHFFATKLGLVKSLAIGDFTVSMGQGLIQWEGMAFSKSAEITSVKRQSPVLRPYASPGESNFHRGIGITLQKARWETTAFVSLQKIGANKETDSVSDPGHITSLLSSGYHRTASELEDKNNVRQFSAGASFSYTKKGWRVSLNAVHYRFSIPIQKQDRPYNLFALQGRYFTNISLDYSYTYKNVHLFGEAASDKNYNHAFVNGVLISLAPSVDVSLLQRSISRDYQAVYGSAFTENTMPSNEKGLFAGVSIRPSSLVRLDAYSDVFKFPWLKYRVDAPSWGREYFLELSYIPNKQVEISTRYAAKSKQENKAGDNTTTSLVNNINRRNWRIHANVNISRSFTIRNRCEVIWYETQSLATEQGFLTFIDFLYSSALKPWSGNLRLMYFETEGYNSRLYAYENDVLYNFSIPAFFDKGYRCYLNLHADLSRLIKKRIDKKLSTECWVRYAQTIFIGKNEISEGLDQISGNKKTELKLELKFGL